MTSVAVLLHLSLLVLLPCFQAVLKYLRELLNETAEGGERETSDSDDSDRPKRRSITPLQPIQQHYGIVTGGYPSKPVCLPVCLSIPYIQVVLSSVTVCLCCSKNILHKTLSTSLLLLPQLTLAAGNSEPLPSLNVQWGGPCHYSSKSPSTPNRKQQLENRNEPLPL